MGLGTMGIDGGMATDLRAARMTGNTLTAVKDLDAHRRITHVEFAMEQSVGDAVVMPFDFNVVIDVDAHFFPFGKRVRFGGQRTESRTINRGKTFGAVAFQFAETVVVEPI